MATRTLTYIGYTCRGSGTPAPAIIIAQDDAGNAFALYPSGDIKPLKDSPEEIKTKARNLILYREGERIEHNPKHRIFAFAEDDLYVGESKMLRVRFRRRKKSLESLPERDEEQEERLITYTQVLKLELRW